MKTAERAPTIETYPGVDQELVPVLLPVVDPEIPTISLLDLGVIRLGRVADGRAEVVITPTFAGCSAIGHMRESVAEALAGAGYQDAVVRVDSNQPWSSELISVAGRAAIARFGIAPPSHTASAIVDLDLLTRVGCPSCGSENTVMQSPFGPTLCRAIHYCQQCHQAFEAFKPL